MTPEAANERPKEGPAVRLEGVRRTYLEGGTSRRDVPVLDGVDLVVERGESVAVIGPSGSGKSTLLNIVGALDDADGGGVEVLGRSLTDLDEDELAHLRNRELGFVFQFHQLLPDFTVLENVAMPGRIGGDRIREVEARAMSLLEEVGLTDRADFFPAELSGGERQRVAMCRALVNEPELLLADEPTGNLDSASGHGVLDLLLRLRGMRGMTLLVVTHDHEVASRCERVLRLTAGRLEPA